MRTYISLLRGINVSGQRQLKMYALRKCHENLGFLGITTYVQIGEEIAFSDKAVYLYCPNGYRRTRLINSFLENKLKVWATTRNWKTTNELYKIALQGT
jgi:uncharacterized protein (DUF1697 family)